MQIVEFSMPVNAWQGLNTRYPADTKFVGADDFVEGSKNFLTSEHGVITKRSGTDFYNPSPLANAPKDQYEAIFDDGIRHLLIMEGAKLQYSTGDRIFHEVTNAYTANSNWEFATFNNRVYFGNGVDTPQVYDNQGVYGGVTTSTPAVKSMGAAAPGSAPTAGASTAGGSVPSGAHTYKYTFLYYDSEESNGSAASGVVTIVGNHTVPLTIAAGPLGTTARKIYRDDNDGNWLLVKTISDNTTTSTTDTAALGTTPIPTDNGVPHIFSLIVNHRDRLWVAGVADNVNKVYYSDAGFPDIYPVNNIVRCNPKDPITGLLVFNDKVLVFNRYSMGQILGTTSDDFRYSEISNNVGCVDNRSIRIRTINGVPVVIWLSELDFYAFNGSQLVVISDLVSSDLQLNIQQAANAKSKNIQSTQADFAAGTASPGIDITDVPGVITTHGYSTTTNPTKLWDTEAEWTAGSSLTNVAQFNVTNEMQIPTTHSPAFTDGDLSSTVVSGSDLKLPVTASFTGETKAYNGFQTQPYVLGNVADTLATPIIPTRSGTLTNYTANHLFTADPAGDASFQIWSDNAGTPNAAIASFSPAQLCNPTHVNPSWSGSVHLTGGTRYWLVVFGGATGPGSQFQFAGQGATPFSGGSLKAKRRNGANVWGTCTLSGGEPLLTQAGSYTFTPDPVANTGTWTGPTYDTHSATTVANLISHTASYPSGTSAITYVDATNDPDFLTGITTTSSANLNGTAAVATTNLRYWRIRIALSTTDDSITPTINPASLSFALTGTWISEVIDHTSNITTLDALTLVSSSPAGCSAAVTIATSTDNITYSGYTALGSAVARRYSKVKVVMTGNGTATPSVTSVLLNWSITANLVSSAIDTVTIPAGWGIFQADSDLNGGLLTFEVRTAATALGLAAAVYAPATNGSIITNAVLRFIQWRVTISSSANNVPEVRSIIINWLNTLTQGVRVASLFYNKNYYMAAASYGTTKNNLVFVYDQNGTWKKFEGLSIATMGLFFSEPYYGDAVAGTVVKWLDPGVLTDQGSDIEMNVRTKAFGVEIGDETKTKMLRSLVLKAMGTGARLTPTYSVDGGTTFLPLANVDTGLAYYDTPADDKLHFIRFSPASAQTQWDYTLMIQVNNNDEFPVEIHGMRARVFLSERPVR